MAAVKKDGGQKITKEYHILFTHMSARSMKYNTTTKFSRDGMNKEINKYVACFKICKMDKNIYKRNDYVLFDVKKKNKSWEIDLIDLLKMTVNRNRYIFTLVDYEVKMEMLL